MSPLAWFMAVLGSLTCWLLQGMIVLDVWFEMTQRETISRDLLNVGYRDQRRHERVAVCLCLIIGAFLGHFWFPQAR